MRSRRSSSYASARAASEASGSARSRIRQERKPAVRQRSFAVGSSAVLEENRFGRVIDGAAPLARCPPAGHYCALSATGDERIDSGHGTFSFDRLYRLGNREFFGLLTLSKRTEAKLLAAIAAGGLVLTPAFATTANSKKRPPAVSLSFDPISSFTPANADPRLAAALAGKGLALTDFKFTPAPAKGRPSQVRVAIRARVTAPPVSPALGAAADSTVSALAPAGYNLGVGVGWRRFAISGDVAKVKDADSALGGRESAVVGISYSLKRFTGRVAVGADRAVDHPLTGLRKGDNYS